MLAALTLVASASAAEPSVDPVLQKAATLRAAGRFDEALDALRTESRTIKGLHGEQSPRLLPINDLAAEILVDAGSLETARPLLDKAIATRKQFVAAGRKDAGAALGNSWLTLARLEVAAKRLPAAASAAREALLAFDAASPAVGADQARAARALTGAVDDLDSLLGPEAESTRTTRAEAAATFTSLGMAREAIEQRRRLLEGLLAAAEAKPEDIRRATEQLASLMMLTGHAEEALEVVEKASAVLGDEHPRDSIAVRRLVNELRLAADQLVVAEASAAQLQEESLALGPPPPSPAIAAGDRLLGLLAAVRRGDDGRLPEWFEPTVASLAKSSSGDLAAAGSGLVLAAEIHRSRGNPTAAAELLAKALAVATATRTPDATLVAELSAALAAARLTAGEVAAARTITDRALPAAEKALGPGDPRTGLLRLVRADALLQAGETDAASAAASQALQRGLPRPDAGWEELAVDLYDRLAGATDQEEDLRQRFLAARAEQFGGDHPHVAAACDLFGAARLAAGDWQAAREFFARGCELRRTRLGDEHPDVAASLALLAHAESMAGMPQEALATAARSVATWDRVAGPNHPGTLLATEVLLATKLRAGDTTGVVDLLERLGAADGLGDPGRRAAHLIGLADAIAAKDKGRAATLLQEAMRLPCWEANPAATPATRRRLAFAAAVAAHAFGLTGDPAAATTMIQRARGLALQAEDPKPLLDRVDQLATQGPWPAGRQ